MWKNMGKCEPNYDICPSPLAGEGNFSARDKSVRKMGEGLKICLVLTILIIELCPFFANSAFAKKYRVNTPRQEHLYQQKVLIKVEKARYKASLLPFSGYQTVEDYENKSKCIPNADKTIPAPELPNDIKMQYVPQPVFKLTKYNNPPGAAELRIDRMIYYDRQENAQGIVSPDITFMVYPSIYYYANCQCTSADLFILPLDKSLPDVERISRANIVRKLPNPILSTDKSIDQKYVFRTLTPVDFSVDSSVLAIKEKVGYTYDGIWRTDLWVYDFRTQKAKKLVEVRDAIKFYWLNTDGTHLDDKRWDIYPLGFDVKNPERIVVSAYGFTGKTPKFLGTWSIDVNGERTMLVSLFDDQPQISMNGYKLIKSGVVNPNIVMKDKKKQIKLIKKKRKEAKKQRKAAKKKAKKELKKRIKEIKRNGPMHNSIDSKQKWINAPTSID